MDMSAYPLLEGIDEPAHLRELPQSQLPRLTGQLRDYLLNSVARSGGHLAAGLGAVELTVALHYVLETPFDRLVWDVGHQCYPHKILTGRRQEISRVRKIDGPAGFPVRDESPYDTFGVGHSSTAISAALGMALASRNRNENRKTCAVIGDGGLTAGEAFEALNHAGDVRPDLLVVLNDNEMSISENVGALNKTFARLLAGGVYGNFRAEAKQMLEYMPGPMREFAKLAEEHVKGMLIPGTFFEELGFQYFGPVDGHDVDELVTVLERLREMDGPRILHCVTRKGKGYARAEANPIAYHGVKAFDPVAGIKAASGTAPLTYTDVFSQWLCDMAEREPRLWGITPAMREGSGLVAFAERFPDRYLDTAIAEQHAVTMAGGLACEGEKPVLAIYSTFLQRGYDQLIHDIALQNLPVVFALDRAGLVGADGATHHGMFDFSFMRCLPNLTVMAPADERECRQMLSTALAVDGPASVRYPRGRGPGVAPDASLDTLPVGRAEVRRRGKGVALLAFGTMVAAAETLGDELDATVVNMRFVKPLDEDCIREMAETHNAIITLEENMIAGGAGSAVIETLAVQGLRPAILQIGLADRFVDHGERDEQLELVGLDTAGVRRRINDWLGRTVAPPVTSG
ncbi:1-deoxy-D-xylulose-5-phosphate synthase [Spiribacter vilamensis]|uniref:1-deoxy-D-xylulose-5-phosphate synthase n=1 Tax=Spiribacter vilamensis TaxID=531306 RepID=A0A4Q8CZU4_9GAMM|nr:1-deoxy-D-xylulose-5-phosphate synthase [Spiribacter vilamensis]RZU98558.1 1-deoxy-D-xylulose-5-phosphate synthase [Spiribacter vilamensis]TVO60182.1 1-deoxy-D-xylulose-5-phosphate synthase [Spiribacter vilamensis]